jgi:hypothetical protein
MPAWPEATARWLQTIDAAVLFTGICRVLARSCTPGVALLHLAREQVDVAVASINAAVAGAPDPLTRARLRAAQVEIALADSDTATPDAVSTDLADIAETFGSSGLRAMAEQARGKPSKLTASVRPCACCCRARPAR